MTPVQFLYWIQGCLEMNPDLKTLDEKQVEMLRRHVRLAMESLLFAPDGTLFTTKNPSITVSC